MHCKKGPAVHLRSTALHCNSQGRWTNGVAACLSGGVLAASLRRTRQRTIIGQSLRPHTQHTNISRAASSGPDAPSAPVVLKTHRHYEGTLFRCSHKSRALGGLDMKFSVYVPDTPRVHAKLPYPEDVEGFPMVLYLSGITCSDENVITKGNAQEHCAANGLIFVAPDTSPRGTGLEGEDARWDFGAGAGFYLNATQDPWKQYFQMAAYIEDEFQDMIHDHFPTLGKDYVSLMGHSMGGMGALGLAFRSPGAYRSVSAIAPLSHPSAVPDGSEPDVRSAFKRYLGDDESTWQKYDPVCLIKNCDDTDSLPPMLIDQGADDEFLASGVLRTFDLVEACRAKAVPIEFKLRAGHDHSYFYVSSVMEEHIDFHAKFLDE